jgi:hypothetical protein
MASYALLGALSGFRYSSAQRTVWFGPQVNVRPFEIFFCTASGFGSIGLDGRRLRIRMLEGELPLQKLVLTERTQTKVLNWKTTVRPDSPVIKLL